VQEVKRRWRDYRTAGGQRPIKEFLMALPPRQRAAVNTALAEVRERGNWEGEARKLRGRIWEVRARQDDVTFRILYASVGSRGRILLSLDGFVKKTQKTPPARIRLAEQRLRDWESRG
jgi:phage-related protein